MNLTTQDGQGVCFQNVAAQLQPGGCFVIEVMVPELQQLPPGETVRVFTLNPTHLGVDEYDVASQGLVSHHYWVVDGRLEPRSVPFRKAKHDWIVATLGQLGLVSHPQHQLYQDDPRLDQSHKLAS